MKHPALLNLSLVFALAIGCSESKQPPQVESIVSTPPATNSNADLVRSWKQFVQNARSRESKAAVNWQGRRTGATRFYVEWMHEDIKYTNSLSDPVVGIITARNHSFMEPGLHFIKEYNLEFVPDGNSWTYRRGTQQRLDGKYADPNAEPYPQLSDENVILYAP